MNGLTRALNPAAAFALKSALPLALALVLGAGAAAAEPLRLNTKSGKDAFRAQTALLDSRAAAQYSYSVNLQPQRVIVPGTPEALAAARYDGPYLDLARSAAGRHRIPEQIFLRLVQQESGWNAAARSPKGALGLAQLMPQTARHLRVDPLDPRQNLEGGARYLRMMYERFGDWRLALAAYNAGPEAVDRYRGIPPYAETRNYVRAIIGS